ncbi:MAG TPA: hypothetical protein VG325_07175 [Solirubrobacteraceae bacterium]|nr:hypothetical protein [Solirubrobacteraceae bacterium]
MVIHPRVRRSLTRIVGITCCVFFAGAGAALASCRSQPLSTPFAQWGDTSNYFLVPGGSFEGTPDQVGWSLSNAGLTPANEPFQVGGNSDQQSLTINAGGSATSPYFCVDNTMTDLRFFAQQVTAGSDLQVQALVQTDNGVETVPVGNLADGSDPAWAPTDPIAGNTAAIPSGQSLMVALQLVVPASSGSWQLDDIYVDPWRSG